MGYNPQNPNGQATSANSAPVVIASDQSAVPVSSSTLATSSNQTNANQKTQIVDGSGNVIGSTSNALNVNLASGSGTIGSVKLTDGTNTANVISGDTGYNGEAIASANKTISFSTSTSGAQILGPYNVEGYAWVEVNLTSAGTGLAYVGQWCATSGGTYFSTSSWGAATPNGYGGLGTTTNYPYGSAVHGNYFQLDVTALSSGVFSGTITLRGVPPTGVTTPVNAYQLTNPWNVGAAYYTTVTGTITSSSSTVSSGNYGYGSLFAITVNGTYAGVSFGITVEDSGGIYYNVPVFDQSRQCWIASGATITPGTNASNTYWVSALPGVTNTAVKVTASAWTSGTANIRFQAQSVPAAISNSTMSQIMDSAGNARGANVDANNNLDVTMGTALSASIDSVSIGGGLMPTGTAYNAYEAQLSAASTTVTSTISYISSITFVVITGQTGGTISVQDLTNSYSLVNAVPATAAGTAPTTYNFQTPVKMTGGFKIVLGGSTAPTVNFWINYYQ